MTFVSIWYDWACGERTITDFSKRLVNALKDANMDNSNVDKFLDWFSKAVKYTNRTEWNGAAIVYTIYRGQNGTK